MKHTEAKAFVRKYNAELAIRGYSKRRAAVQRDTARVRRMAPNSALRR